MKDRRNLLKGIAVGSAWSVPVVSSVVLPAHATTSCGELVLYDNQNTEHRDIFKACGVPPTCEEFLACMAESCIDLGEEWCR